MMISMIVIASNGRMFWVFEMPMRPTVRHVGAKIGSAGRDGWSGVGGKNGRRGDRARSGHGNRACCGGARSVGAVEAGGTCGCSETAILVGCTEVNNEVGKRFAGFRLGAPITTRNIEKASRQDEVVPETDDRRGGRSVVARSRKPDAIVKLGEELVDWRGWVPGGMHPQ